MYMSMLKAFFAPIVTQFTAQGPVVMAGSWSGFKGSMTSFFESGLGGPGMEGVGIAIAAIGIVMAGVSFVMHKFNPQSRLPGPITCLLIGVVGTVLMSGIGRPLAVVKQVGDTFMSWLGV